MKKRSPPFPRVVSMFCLFLTLLPLSLKAAEIRPLFRYAAILTRGVNSGGSARILPGHYETAINAQNANGWPAVTGKKLVLPLTAPTYPPEPLLDAHTIKSSPDAPHTLPPQPHFP